MKGYRIQQWVAAVVLPLMMGGCVQAVGYVYEDRTAERQITDTKIHAGILRRYTKRDTKLPLDVSTDVWKGRVLLTGTLDSSSMRGAVERMVRMDSRVKAIYNEIIIVTKPEKEKRREVTQQKGEPKRGKIGQFVNDAWVNAKISAKLLTTVAVKSVNYRWNAVRGRVAIVGSARTANEKKLVLQIVRGTVGVRKIKDYIQVGTR